MGKSLVKFRATVQQHWYLIALAALVLFRLALIFQIELIDDEAYHWTWAKNIALSYYDHPGMVAWVIWPFVTLFGDYAAVIRLPGLILFLSIVYVVYKTSSEIFDKRTAQLSSLLVFLIPLWGFASLGTLPDVPLALFWMLIVYFFWQSVRPDSRQWSVKKSWILIGITMGLGMNSKLACCLIGLGMGLYLVCTPKVRKHLKTPWPYLAIVITFLMMIPIFLWQQNHDWATFEYQFHRRHQEALGLDFNRWLQFWSYQWIFMSPGIYLSMLMTIYTGFKKFKDDRWRFLLLLPLPTLLIFYYQPLYSAYKPHWSGPAYMILLIGASHLLLTSSKWVRRTLVSISVFFLFVLNLIYIPLFYPVIPKIYKHFNDPTTWQPKWDFSNEFYGWLELGGKVKSLQEKIVADNGQMPLLGAQRYELISQLTYAAKEKVWQLTFEKDQFHFDQPEKEKQKLIGHNFLVVNNDKYPRNPMEISRFDKCEETDFPVYRNGELARTFFIYYCTNYQGQR